MNDELLKLWSLYNSTLSGNEPRAIRDKHKQNLVAYLLETNQLSLLIINAVAIKAKLKA